MHNNDFILKIFIIHIIDAYPIGGVGIARTTISLPDDLVTRLEPLRDRVNVSEICRIALEARVTTYEHVQEALSEEDVMERLIMRLRASREGDAQGSYDRGRTDGYRWAMNEATYGELVFMENSQESLVLASGDQRFPFTEQIANDLEYAQDKAKENADYFDVDAYTRGYLEAAGEVWRGVQGLL